MNPEKMTIKEELSKHQKNLEKEFFANPLSTYAVKTITFSGNTARAYRKQEAKPGCYLNYTPTSIFRHWVHKYYLGNNQTLKLLNEGADFQLMHSAAIESLETFWRKTEPKAEGLQYFHFTKVIDLLFKSIARWDELSRDRQKWFFDRVNVPLDKYSLAILTEFHTGYKIKNPSMNFVGNDPEKYKKIQKDIRELITPFPPLLFDLYAWDHRRKLQMESEETFELKTAE